MRSTYVSVRTAVSAQERLSLHVFQRLAARPVRARPIASARYGLLGSPSPDQMVRAGLPFGFRARLCGPAPARSPAFAERRRRLQGLLERSGADRVRACAAAKLSGQSLSVSRRKPFSLSGRGRARGRGAAGDARAVPRSTRHGRIRTRRSGVGRSRRSPSSRPNAASKCGRSTSSRLLAGDAVLAAARRGQRALARRARGPRYRSRARRPGRRRRSRRSPKR